MSQLAYTKNCSKKNVFIRQESSLNFSQNVSTSVFHVSTWSMGQPKSLLAYLELSRKDPMSQILNMG
jgi:hypothetical protein